MTSIPSVSAAGERRHARLRDARLAAVVDATRPPADLERLLRTLSEASVDVCCLRDDEAGEDALRGAAEVFRRVCDAAGTLFVLDRLPGLALEVGADGVQIAPIDIDPDHARRIVGPDVLIGRAVRSSGEIDQAADEDVDYLVVGRDRGWTELEALVAHAAGHASHPWFVVASEPGQAEVLVNSGARRILVEGLGQPGAGDDPASIMWALRRTVAAHPLA
jgi:thiamine-phosphate pyrophosphorylase